MFDINEAINSAIAKAVEAHMSSIEALYSNALAQLEQEMADIRQKIDINDQAASGRISALESGWMHITDQQVAPLSARVDNLSAKVNELRPPAADFDCPAFGQAVRDELYQMQIDDSLKQLISDDVKIIVCDEIEDLDIGDKIEEALKYNVTLKVVVD